MVIVNTHQVLAQIPLKEIHPLNMLMLVILNKNITVIDQRAFQDCTSMESCYIKATIPPALGTWAFDNNPCKIYVPHESVATYKAATNWNLYASQIYVYDF